MAFFELVIYGLMGILIVDIAIAIIVVKRGNVTASGCGGMAFVAGLLIVVIAIITFILQHFGYTFS